MRQTIEINTGGSEENTSIITEHFLFFKLIPYCMSNDSDGLGDVFDEHVKCEFVDKDVDATMKTMVREPYVHHVPLLTGGVGTKVSTIFTRMILLVRCQTMLKSCDYLVQ
jgi:hypothetical protein